MDEYTNESIWKALKTVKYSSSIKSTASRSDRIFYRLMQEGMKENNIDKLYEFINAMENVNIFPYDSRLYEIIRRAYTIDANRLFSILAAKNDLLLYWALLSMCNTDMLCTFAKIGTQNILFYYECARQLLKRYALNSNYIDGLIPAVLKIANNDQSLWKRWIKEFEYDTNWSKSIFLVLRKVSKSALLTYANSIAFDLPYKLDLIKIFTEQLQTLTDEDTEYIFNTISETICRRWTDFVLLKKAEPGAYSKLFISDYINIIIYSLNTLLQGPNDWAAELEKWIDILKKDMQKWFVSITQMSKYYFLDLSHIYYLLILKCGTDTKKLNSQEQEYLDILRRYINRYSYLSPSEANCDMEELFSIINMQCESQK